MTVVDCLQFKADDSGYNHVCAFLGTEVTYNEEDATIEVTLADKSSSEVLTLEDGDFIIKADDGKVYACIEINPGE